MSAEHLGGGEHCGGGDHGDGDRCVSCSVALCVTNSFSHIHTHLLIHTRTNTYTLTHKQTNTYTHTHLKTNTHTHTHFLRLTESWGPDTQAWLGILNKSFHRPLRAIPVCSFATGPEEPDCGAVLRKDSLCAVATQCNLNPA